MLRYERSLQSVPRRRLAEKHYAVPLQIHAKLFFSDKIPGFSLFTCQQVIRFATTCCLPESARGKAKFEDTEADIRASRPTRDTLEREKERKREREREIRRGINPRGH